MDVSHSEGMTHLECMCRFYLGECFQPRTKAVSVTVSCGVCIFKTMEKVFLLVNGVLRVEPGHNDKISIALTLNIRPISALSLHILTE